jgi:predicted nucleic acid-binding protein
MAPPRTAVACGGQSRPDRVRGLVRRPYLVSATIDLLRRAGDLAETHARRRYDAVHLASIEAIADPETVMVTADHQLRTATLDQGLATANLPT